MEKKEKEINSKKIFWIGIRIFIILVFVLLTLSGSQFHERWSDEAQAWLLARDASIPELLFRYAYDEGSPILWHLILKFAIVCHLPYSLFGIIPIFFTVIGLILLEFKLRLPWYIKVFLPFTYYIFYQYTIVARNYCLIFPTLCYLAMLYPKRKEKIVAYVVGLGILSSISIHGCILSGSLFLLYLGETIASKWKEKKSIMHLLSFPREWVSLLILGMYYLFTIYILIPKDGVLSNPGGVCSNLGRSFLEIISEATFCSTCEHLVPLVLATICTMTITIILSIRAKKENRKIVILIGTLLAFFLFFYCNAWHIGILTQTLLFVWYILSNNDEGKERIWERVFLPTVFVFLLGIQILWSIDAWNVDQKEYYSLGEYIAEKLQEPVKQNQKIFGIEYSITAILPYFEKNIFANFANEKQSFYHWKQDKESIVETQELLEENADIYVLSEAYLPSYQDLVESLVEKGYEGVRYSSATKVKGNPHEFSGYILLWKNEKESY